MNRENLIKLLVQNKFIYWTLEKLDNYTWNVVGNTNDLLFIKNEDSEDTENLQISISQLEELFDSLGAGIYRMTCRRMKTSNGKEKITYPHIVIKETKGFEGLGLGQIHQAPAITADDVEKRIAEAVERTRLTLENERLKQDVEDYEKFIEKNSKLSNSNPLEGLGSLLNADTISAIGSIIAMFKGGAPVPAPAIAGTQEPQPTDEKAQAAEALAKMAYENFEKSDFQELFQFMNQKIQIKNAE